MKRLAKMLLVIEPALLVILAGAFWFDNPDRIYFLLLLIPPALGRLILYRRLWVNVAISLPVYLFLLICVVNTAYAMSSPPPPYSWGWYMLGRPVMGAGLALLVGVLGLTSAQFLATKSGPLEFLIERLPKLTTFPGAVGGFNVNEIGGAMAFFAPLTAGIALYDARNARAAWVRVTVAATAFAVLALALFLGQSRLAIIGVVVGLALVIVVVIRTWRWRAVAFALLLVFCALEIGMVTGFFEASSSSTDSAGLVSERDEQSLSQRPVIWGAALSIIRDYPLTGVGLNQFRSREVRANYPVPNFAMTVVPHAHNELLQVGTDAGIPGLMLYVAWHIALAIMLWRTWRDGEPFAQAVAASVAAGLLAHAIFGLADAITLFDRFTWAYWLLVGLAGAVSVTTRRKAETSRSTSKLGSTLL